MTLGGLLDGNWYLERLSHEKLGIYSPNLLSFRVNDCSGLSNEAFTGTSLAVQWLRFHTSAAGGMSSIPDQVNKIPQAMQYGKKIEKKKKKASTEIPKVWGSESF